MGFEGLLGNDRLKENLRASLRRGKTAHFYLISGPAGSGKRTLARLLGAALLCREQEKPCLRCPSCRKVMADTHPDFITLQDPEHKTVAVKLVRELRDDMFIRPNEAERKVCMLPQELGIEGQNALLKVLEEPPAYGVFVLLTDNPEKLLPTVRSRCIELALHSLPEAVLMAQLRRDFPQADSEALAAAAAQSGGYLGQAKRLLEENTTQSPQTERFVHSFGEKDALGLLQVLAGMERWKRDQLLEELIQWESLLQGALVSRSGVQVPSAQARSLGTARTGQDLLRAVRELQKAIEYTQGNVSVAAVCGYLEWALR